MFVSVHNQHLISAQQDVRSITPLPMVYEDIPVKPAQWEYFVLAIDPREEAFPEASRLNELGKEGWLLVGVLDGKASGGSSQVHYYFVRQHLQEGVRQ